MTGPGAPPPGAAALPGWLGPVVTLTTQVGVPTVVAGVLLWFVLVRVDGAMHEMLKADAERTQIIAAMQDKLIQALDQQSQKFEQAIALNIQTNKDLADRYHRGAQQP